MVVCKSTSMVGGKYEWITFYLSLFYFLSFTYSSALPFNPYFANVPLFRAGLERSAYHDVHFLTPLDFQNALTTPEKRPTEEDLQAMQLPNLFEGDITGFLTDDQRVLYDVGDIFKYPQNSALNLVTFPDKLWPKGRIPYMLEERLNEFERLVVAQAFDEYKNKTCIRFVPKDDYDIDYIYIKKNRDTGCSSFVGRAGGNQTISLEIDKCFSKGIIAHELMHVLGFFHEHSRTDRDKYIKVVDENIAPGMIRNFEKYPQKVMDTLDMPYDYGSVMHYHKLAFSRNGKPTIVPYDNKAEIGQRYKLSDIDAAKVNKLYDCDNRRIVDIEETSFITTTTTTTSQPWVVGGGKSGGKEDRSREIVDKDKSTLFKPCIDFNDHCKMWAEIGHCKWSEKYMAHYCKESCDLCAKETVTDPPINNCVDQNLFCSYWAKIGECNNESKFMRTFCKRACGTCDEYS